MEYKIPSDTNAEINVLGGMMNNKECLYEALSELDVEYFTLDETRKIFSTIEKLSNEGNVTRRLLEKKTDGNKEKALIQTADSTYKDIDVFKVDLENLKNTYINRQLYYTTTKALSAISENAKAIKTIETIENEISELYFDDEGTNIIDPKERAPIAYQRFLDSLENPDVKYGIRFSYEGKKGVLGFPGLDEVFRGAQGGDLFLIAAKTGEGKTAFSLNLARLFSLYQKYYGYYENTEMKVEELEERLLAPLASVKVTELSTGQLEGTKSEIDSKITRISAVYDHYRNSHLYLSRIPSLTASKAKGLAKQVRNRYGKLDYLMIDYLGRMEMSDSYGLQEYQIMFKITQQMKELAMSLDIPIFLLAQRNFDGNIEGAKKIANECDGVLFFEPVTEDDTDYIDSTFSNPEKRKKVNYKITKRKIRRSSNTFPIYCEFDKEKQFINEVPTS